MSLLDTLLPNRTDTTSGRIAKHERLIQILEAIQSMQNRKAIKVEMQGGFFGSFPGLVERGKHQIEICEMAIARLEARYQKELTELSN